MVPIEVVRQAAIIVMAFYAGTWIAHCSKSNVVEIRRAPGFKPWRMSKWTAYQGRLETQGLIGDPSLSVAGQMKQALEKLESILQEAGTNRSQLLHVTIWLKDIENTDIYDEMNEVYDEYLSDCYNDGGKLPTRVCIGAALSGGFAVEVRASAAIPRKRKPFLIF